MRSGVDEARDLRCLGINNQRACGLGCGVANSGLSFFWEVRAAGGGGGRGTLSEGFGIRA